MKKLKNTFFGVLIGIVLIIIGTIMLFVNEFDSVKETQILKEVEKQAIFVDSNNILPDNNDKLVITNGDINVYENAVDSVFNVSAKTPKLKRIVEMYQWHEDYENDSNTSDYDNEEYNNDSPTYSYTKGWYEQVIDATQFEEKGYTNPTTIPYSEDTFISSNVTLGSFSLTDTQKNEMDLNSNLYLSNEVVVPANFYVTSEYITNSKDISNPEIGDIRISYKYSEWPDATVLAVQSNNTFKDFLSSTGKKVNKIKMGKSTKSEMVEKIKNENNNNTWMYRAVGAMLVILGYFFFFSPLTSVIHLFSFLGSVFNVSMSALIGLLGVVHSLVVIMIAWVFVRPILGIFVVILIVGVVIFVKKKAETNNMNPQQIDVTVTNDSIANSQNVIDQQIVSNNVQSFVTPQSSEQIVNDSSKNTLSNEDSVSLMNPPPLVDDDNVNNNSNHNL